MPEQVFTNCTEGGPVFVHVRDGKITRIRPIVFDQQDGRSWTIEAHGRSFSPPRKATLAPFTLAERAKVYSDKRIKYPLKRRDFDPNGDRHPELRGRSAYERISWDEALDTVAREIKRIRADYGPAAVTAMRSSHAEWGLLFFRNGPFGRFFQMLGHTAMFDNPDSFEGWLWGATHASGFYWRVGIPEQSDLLEDALKNTELVVHWSNDPDTTHGWHGAQESAIWRYWLRDLGIKQVFIDPFCNYTAAILGDKWIAPRPGTDAAMAMAIAYVWIEENTYDKDYLSLRTIGFEQFRSHIKGEDDGVPKTPEWAQEITGVSGRTIKALAREWASKRTMLAAGTAGGQGGACRQAYATEWARLMVLLQAMQGLGKPGVNIWGTATGAPRDSSFRFPGFEDGGPDTFSLVAKKPAVNSVTQRVYRLLVPECILNPPVTWSGEGFCVRSLEQQFIPYTYPEPGSPEIKMVYRYGGSFIGTMTGTNRWVKMYQSPKLEFVVNQDCWWHGETGLADIVLPASSNFERSDISEWANESEYGNSMSNACNHRIIVYQKKCIEPLWESRPDYQIFSDLAERLGFREEYTEGNSEEDWIKKLFDAYSLPKYISYEDFKKKGYFVVPFPTNYKPTPALRWFYEGRECDTPDIYNPKKGTEKSQELGTYSGKIEFVSRSLTELSPDDKERPPMPRYIPSWEGYDSELAKKYPLQLLSPQQRFSFHTHHDINIPWLDEIPSHRICKYGYSWHVARIHPSDADVRGIKDRDIIKMYNDRGAVLCIAQITERVRPGVVHSYGSSGIYDPVEPGKAGSLDRGGSVNLLTPSRMLSANAPGMAPNSCLIEISRWEV
jgi:anaerobic selenocysteine-containing dehydrogenase